MLAHAAILQQLEGAPIIEQRSVNAAQFSLSTVSAASVARTPSFVGFFAAAAAAATIAANSQNRARVWEDLDLLKSAVARGEIVPEAPVAQSFFPPIRPA